MQKVSDTPLKRCPHCGKPQLQKLMSAPVFRLKGAGWYETDFKSDQDNKRNLADRPEAESSKDDKKEATEAAAKDAPAADAAKPAEKSADKPAEKAASAEPASKPAEGAVSKRKPATTANKSNSRKAVKRPSRPAVRRSAPKPARRR
jgi:predicted nucleic acid-binding Zn ribbon protein